MQDLLTAGSASSGSEKKLADPRWADELSKQTAAKVLQGEHWRQEETWMLMRRGDRQDVVFVLYLIAQMRGITYRGDLIRRRAWMRKRHLTVALLAAAGGTTEAKVRDALKVLTRKGLASWDRSGGVRVSAEALKNRYKEIVSRRSTKGFFWGICAVPQDVRESKDLTLGQKVMAGYAHHRVRQQQNAAAYRRFSWRPTIHVLGVMWQRHVRTIGRWLARLRQSWGLGVRYDSVRGWRVLSFLLLVRGKEAGIEPDSPPEPGPPESIRGEPEADSEPLLIPTDILATLARGLAQEKSVKRPERPRYFTADADMREHYRDSGL